MSFPAQNYWQPGGLAAGGHLSTRGRPAETTGRSLVLMRHGKEALESGIKVMRSAAGMSAVSAADLAAGAKVSDLAPSTAMLFDQIGVAVINGDPDQVGRLSIQATRSDSILAVEPERVLYASVMPQVEIMSPVTSRGSEAGSPPASVEGVTRDYLRGFRDGFEQAANLCFPAGAMLPPGQYAAVAAALNESAATWGLQVTRVIESTHTGRGVKLAVLDTGLVTSHPDFAGRVIDAESFVAAEPPLDRNGHGTHCTGTAAGPRVPGVLPRYGIAYECEIYMGKVLSNQGSGSDGSILAGIDWAIGKGCRVVSMSFGATPGPKPSTVYENVARRALAAGTLLVAAAGNESDRRTIPPFIAPVDHPANCPSIMAVAAIDSAMRVAWFSCAGMAANGGQVDIAAPGVNVRSTWLMPQQYNVISGTSMATPHVAGIAALYIEANPGITATDLWTKLVKTARPLGWPAADVGSGLVQAPVP